MWPRRQDPGAEPLGGWDWKWLGVWQRRVAQLLVLSASVLLSAVSLFTTYAGLRTYFDWLPAFSLAAGVQLGLLGLAWLIRGGGWRTIGIYGIVMIFSVTFTFIFLQSELTREMRTSSSRAALAGVVSAEVERLGTRTAAAQRANSEALSRLVVWQGLERSTGFSTRVCGTDPIAFLVEACGRLRAVVAGWEASTGKTYKAGPGERLIFGALTAELEVARGDSGAMARYLEILEGVARLPEQTRAADRLAAYRRAASLYPAEILVRYSGGGGSAPATLQSADFQELTTVADGQWQAFIELARLFQPERQEPRLSLATAFSFALAIFIDGIVLAIAIGAGSGAAPPGDGGPPRTVVTGRQASHDAAALDEVGEWMRTALVEANPALENEETLVADVLEHLETEEGQDAVTVSDRRTRRFLDAMVRSNAAEFKGATNGKKRFYTYVLRPQVPSVLLRYLARREEEDEAKRPRGGSRDAHV